MHAALYHSGINEPNVRIRRRSAKGLAVAGCMAAMFVLLRLTIYWGG